MHIHLVRHYNYCEELHGVKKIRTIVMHWLMITTGDLPLELYV